MSIQVTMRDGVGFGRGNVQVQGDSILTSPTGAWTDVERAGDTVSITDARNKINDLQQQEERLRYSSNSGSQKRRKELNHMIANAIEDLARHYDSMRGHLVANADRIRREAGQHDQ